MSTNWECWIPLNCTNPFSLQAWRLASPPSWIVLFFERHPQYRVLASHPALVGPHLLSSRDSLYEQIKAVANQVLQMQQFNSAHKSLSLFSIPEHSSILNILVRLCAIWSIHLPHSSSSGLCSWQLDLVMYFFFLHYIPPAWMHLFPFEAILQGPDEMLLCLSNAFPLSQVSSDTSNSLIKLYKPWPYQWSVWPYDIIYRSLPLSSNYA